MMDDLQKQVLKAELSALKSIIAASTSMTSGLNQTTYVAAGPAVTIPSLPMAAQAFRSQAECMDKLANLLEKVINAS